MTKTMKSQPKISVGILDRQTGVGGKLEGNFRGKGFGPLSGRFSAKAEAGTIVLTDESGHEINRSPSIRLMAEGDSSFSLFDVTIGSRFHWERTEDQSFGGDLILQWRNDGTMAAINEIPAESYLEGVISSEMNAASPIEFLKAHAILSRSWLLAALARNKNRESSPANRETAGEGEVIRWYEREDHDLFDVCADDHCQRYHGISKRAARRAEEAVRETAGLVMTHRDEICDARYSKACGGLTEEFDTAWEDTRIPYLSSISDAPVRHAPISTEEEASSWVFSSPEAYCNTRDKGLLKTILPEFDRGTIDFFRWKIEYSRTDLEQILQEKSGIDFGTLQGIIPLRRGPSGRICRLRIVGSKKGMVVGKELEIRRWLSRSHLYSSAFVVLNEGDRFVFHGAGWGHGVGLCQIGAAVMATRGFSAEKILKHYFQGIEIRGIY